MLLTRFVFSCRIALALGFGFAFAFTSQLGGCKPELQDGRYSCNNDAQCPDGWSCDDDLCYSKAQLNRGGSDGGAGHDHGGSDSPDAGSVDAGGGDPGSPGAAGTGSGSTGTAGTRGSSGSGGAGVAGQGGSGAGNGGSGNAGGAGSGASGSGALASYTVCEAGTSCAGGSCVLGPDNTAQHGVCAQSCGADSGCPANHGQPGVCLLGPGACVPGCASSSDCPPPLECRDIAVGPMQTRAVCIEIESPDLLGTATCMPSDMGSCGRGAVCAFSPDTTPAGGVCSYRCDTTQSCPQGGTCVEVFQGVRQCFKPCASPPECGALTCGAFDGRQLCIPPGWVGRAAPLPMPPMMM